MTKPSTFFCRVGSKKPIREAIIRQSPKEWNTFVEPFVGSGAIYFAMNDPDKKAVINDLDKELMAGYKQIKNGVSGNIEKFNKLSLSQMNSFVNKTPTNEMDRLAKRLYMSCSTFGTTGRGKLYKETNIYTKLKNLDNYKEFMKNTTISSKDYASVIRQYDSPTTFFYLDPPYEESGRLYKESDEGIDFQKMATLLKGIKGKFLLSMNDSQTVRDIFKGFNIRGLTVQVQGKKGVGVKPRKEVFIKNY
jgi:DNA adenine methylase